MPGQIHISQVSSGEYRFFMGVYKTLYLASLTTTTAGLVGLAINHFVGPETSGLVKEILSYSSPAALSGGLSTLCFGSQYHVNKSINKHRESNSNTLTQS